MNNYAFTGFPGFLAGKLIEHLASLPHQIGVIYALHLPNQQRDAEVLRDTLLSTTSLAPPTRRTTSTVRSASRTAR